MIDPRATALDKLLTAHPELLEGASLVAIFRALHGAYLAHLKSCALSIQQTFKPDAEPWLHGGYEVNGSMATQTDVAIVFATKHREETLAQMAVAVQHLKEGGYLIVTAANELGAPSLERRGGELLGRVSSFSKQKCRVFWGRKDSALLNTALMTAWLNESGFRPVSDSGLLACAGVFSAKTIDPGSRLLADHLPDTLRGLGADYGSGYAYLSHQVLSRNPGIREWHLYEAESRALDAARLNLEGLSLTADLHYHWCDVQADIPDSRTRFDCIVMNPPFHTGRSSRPELGQSFIRQAAAQLAPGGVLYLVANRQLPYEATLSQLGLTSTCLATAGGYKIISARHG